MKRLLYIQASPRLEHSPSRQVADSFIEAYKESHPHDNVIPMDLFSINLPGFDGLAVQAKRNIANGKEHSPEELFVWEGVESLINDFKAADKYVIASTMWNFGVPYRLKQYLDIVVQPGYTFSFSRESGCAGLLKGKSALLILARGDEFPADAANDDLDFHERYLEHILRFIGITDIHAVQIDPDWGDEERLRLSIDKALKQLATLGRTF